MAKTGPVEMDRTDMTTLLGCLASDLRNAGLAVRGMSYRGPDPQDQEMADMDRLAGSLDRVASVLDAARGHLYKTCQLLEVSERVRVNPAPRLEYKVLQNNYL